MTLHKSSGQARVRVQGRDRYLGRYGEPETNERYARLIAELAAQQRLYRASATPVRLLSPPEDLTVSEMILVAR